MTPVRVPEDGLDALGRITARMAVLVGSAQRHVYLQRTDVETLLAQQAESDKRIGDLEAALEPFIEAGLHGVAIADAVKAANLPKAGLTTLMCPEIPAGVHAAESCISFADWKRVAALKGSSNHG